MRNEREREVIEVKLFYQDYFQVEDEEFHFVMNQFLHLLNIDI